MLNRKFFVLSLLASLVAWGCSDDKSKESDDPQKTETCNNDGVLDEGEVCDGDQFAANARVCPANTTGDVSQIKCKSDCTLDTTVCKPVDTSKCGNSTLDEGEVCDGDQFAENARVCPANTTGDVSKITCKSDCTLDTSVCAPVDTSKCGNSTLDEGEICDGDQFVENARVCPANMTGDVNQITCKSDCTLDTSVCAPVDTSKCGNSTLDDGEICDGDQFAENARVCPANTTGDVSKITCKSDCTLDTSVCVAETAKCVEDTEECVGKVYRVCVEGEWMEEDCAQKSMVCDVASRTGCVTEEYDWKCEGNKLLMCEGETCIEEDCAESASVCDPVKKDCVPAPFTCEGSVIKLTGTSYSYDCANNAKKSGEEAEKQLCNTVYGCSDGACIGDVMHVCMLDSDDLVHCDGELFEQQCDAGKCSDKIWNCMECEPGAIECDGTKAKKCVDGKWKVEDCAASFLTCDASKGGCSNPSCTTDKEMKCDGNTFMYCDAGLGFWFTEDCGSDKQCDDTKGCVSKTAVCGDGVIQTGEACDGTEIKGKTCADFDKSFKWSGSPACNSACTKIVTGTCVHKTESVVDEWKITDIADMVKNGRLSLKGGFKPTESDGAGGWRLGQWGKATAPSFDGKYIEFISNITGSSKYDSFVFSFTVKRNNSGPRKLKVAFYDGNTQITKSISNEISISTDPETHTVRFLDPSNTGRLSIRVAAYNSPTDEGGTMTISDIKLLATEK